MLPLNSLSLSLLFAALAAAGDAGCQNPGPGRCAGIVYASTYEAGIGGVSDTTASADVVDGDCNSVVTSGSLQPQGTAKGYKGEFQLKFGTLSRIYADNVGTGDIQGVRVEYNGQNLNQDQCRSGSYGFDPAYSLIQCDFNCP